MTKKPVRSLKNCLQQRQCHYRARTFRFLTIPAMFAYSTRAFDTKYSTPICRLQEKKLFLIKILPIRQAKLVLSQRYRLAMAGATLAHNKMAADVRSVKGDRLLTMRTFPAHRKAHLAWQV